MATTHILQLIRPRQWLKSNLVFVGLLFSTRWYDLDLIIMVSILSLAFALIASAMYIINDYIDIPFDQAHPRKKYRPLASGVIKPINAFILANVFIILGLSLATYFSIIGTLILTVYIIINLAYSSVLKKIPVLDVLCISSGYLLRILMGTTAVGIRPSEWLLGCAVLLVLYLALGKRRSELSNHPEPEKTRPVLAHYSPWILDIIISLLSLSGFMTYAVYLYLNHHVYLLFTLPLIGSILLRYSYLLYSQGDGEDPVLLVSHDNLILILLGCWLGATIYLL